MGVCLGVWRLISATSAASAWFPALLLGCPLTALCLAFAFSRKSWKGAAKAVDSHYSLKDRASTALDFLSRPLDTAMKTLQIEDAESHLSSIDPKKVVPWKTPRVVPARALALALACTMMLWPLTSRTVKGEPAAPLAQVVAEAEKIEEDFKELDELAKKEKSKDLEKLIKELMKKVEELKQPGVDVKEAMAKLSEMQTALAAEQAKYNPALVDAQLQSLGEAMSAAESLQDAAQALQNQEHEKAAEKLEQIDPKDVDRKEAKAIKDRMKKLSQQMKDSGMGELGEATDSLAEGLSDGDESEAKSGAKKIAGLARSQAKRKRFSIRWPSSATSLASVRATVRKTALPKAKRRSRTSRAQLSA